MTKQRYFGIPYPIEKNALGLINTGNDISQIKASMLTIIMTVPGERVCLPMFGTALNKLANDPSEVAVDKARMMIAASLKRWEKRVQVVDIRCIMVHNKSSRDLNIQVDFVDPIHMQKIEQLTVQIPGV